LFLDPFSLQQNGLATPEVDIGGCEIAETFMISPVVIMADKVIDLRLKIARQMIVLRKRFPNTLLPKLI
jgi:hypothetical protein